MIVKTVQGKLKKVGKKAGQEEIIEAINAIVDFLNKNKFVINDAK